MNAEYVEVAPKFFIERKEYHKLHDILGMSNPEIVKYLKKETKVRQSIKSQVGRPLLNQLREGFL